MECTHDHQLDAKEDLEISHKGVCTIPNRRWWGVFLIGVPVYSQSGTWGFATVVSPLLTMAILLFLSGMPTAEGVSNKPFENYARFCQVSA